MKPQKTLYYILMFLPLAVTLTALLYLPDQIPAHYGAGNEVTRWGSKYEALLFPAFTILFGCFLLAMAKQSKKQEKNGRNNEKVSIIAGMASLAVFNALTYYFLYTSFHKVENLSQVPVDLNQLIYGLLGITMIIMGNIMPKLRKNSVIGLRTGWSQKNETTWKKSQKFGGISFMIAGFSILVICFLTKGAACVLWTLGIIIILLIVDIWYTYKIAQKY